MATGGTPASRSRGQRSKGPEALESSPESRGDLPSTPGQQTKTVDKSKWKVFNDSVHGHMEFHPLCVAIIDTPEFQRLRYLKQLGVTYFVYPGASHNRFEHSLGVCFLAGKLVTTLRKNQPELGITDEDVLCVEIAGLCHDLGHGPFSHVFDKKFIPKVRPHAEWTHEEASIKLFDDMVKKNELESVFENYGIFDEHRDFIKELIMGAGPDEKKRHDSSSSQKAFLYEIVANKRNEVDVDKWDYFKRDSLHLGMSSTFDHMRFIHFARVIKVEGKQQICVRDKEAFNMYEMFHTRYALHRRAYQHKTVQAVEIMLVEAMKEADDKILIRGKEGRKMPMSECIDDMIAYVKLTDSIFHCILLSDDERLKKAQEILQDIQKRKLYKCVRDSKPITDPEIMKKSEDDIRREILAELEKQDRKETAEEIASRFAVKTVKLDFGKKDENPVDSLWFYNKTNPDKAIKVQSSEISAMTDKKWFREHLVRVFFRPTEDKKKDDQHIQHLKDVFKQWCETNNVSTSDDDEAVSPSKPDKADEDVDVTPEDPTHPE